MNPIRRKRKPDSKGRKLQSTKWSGAWQARKTSRARIELEEWRSPGEQRYGVDTGMTCVRVFVSAALQTGF